MAVPWTGFPLARLLALCERLDGRGKFVRFVSAARPEEMPGWYASRRRLQALVVVGLGTAWLASVLTAIWRVPERRRRYLPMIVVVLTIGFYAAIRRYWPALPDGALAPDYTGIRPKLFPAGGPATDFLIEGEAAHGIAGLVNLFGIESPGLTASLAIAEEVLATAGLAVTA